LLAVLGFRTLLLTTPFEAWHALLISPSDAWPFVQGTLVSIGYAAACLGGGWWLLRRRDFAGSAPASRQANQNLRVRVGVVSVAAVVVLGAASFRPSPVTSASLQKSVTATFLNLAQHKREMIGRPVAINGHVLPAGTSLRLTTTCTRGGQVGPGKGPGDDWTCLMALPGTLQPLFGYEVNAKANGCYTADGATAIMGPLMIRVGNKTVVNPLLEFDGCIDTP
jgi:ABC-2 type transport system permease protein